MLGIGPYPPMETLLAYAQQGRLPDGAVLQGDDEVRVHASFGRTVRAVSNPEVWAAVDPSVHDVDLPGGLVPGAPLTFGVGSFRAVGNVARAGLVPEDAKPSRDKGKEQYEIGWAVRFARGLAAHVSRYVVTDERDGTTVLKIEEGFYLPRVFSAMGETALSVLIRPDQLVVRHHDWLRAMAAKIEGRPD